jgi:SAM-dependent methyltransferase
MQIEGELRCEDFFETSFAPGSFDFVYSIGLIEHFDDPRPIVRRHVEMVKPGGTVMIAIPNYGGLYGRLQRWLDPANLGIHNLGLMSKEALEGVGPTDLCARVEARAAGRLSPWIVSLHCLLPRRVAQGVSLGLNAIGLIQPIEIPALCPMLVLDLTRRR